MADYVLVVAGDWKCSTDGSWEFLVDKNHLSRYVPFPPNTTLAHLLALVSKEFTVADTANESIVITFRPLNTNNLATGITTPPVALSNDGALAFFATHFHTNKTANLFVSFSTEGTSPTPDRIQEENKDACVMPTMPLKTPTPPDHSYSGENKLDDHAVRLNASVTTNDNHAHYDVPPENVAEVVHTNLNNEAIPTESWDSDSEDLLSDGDPPPEIDEIDARPRGYDEEFWQPLLDSEYGGSDAPDILGARKVTSRTVLCTSNDAFDHAVYAGDPPKESKPAPDYSPLRAFPNLDDEVLPHHTPSGQPHHHHTPTRLQRSVHSPSSSNPNTNHQTPSTLPRGASTNGPSTGVVIRRYHPHTSSSHVPPPPPMSAIPDEDFDVPPLFDDSAFAADEIPDLEIDESADTIHVGKIYANKQDCRIALAIYAIKNRFHFKQATTKKTYFVLTCADPLCQWRVMARQFRECGFYEIRKATLEHTCTIETRSDFKKKATSRVIAAVYKSSYRDPIGGPRAAILQQMLLDDLRISASYTKCYRAKGIAIHDIRGSDDDSYLKLPQYLYMVEQANPGTITHIQTEPEEDGRHRFLYAFLSFGASIRGFRKLRHVLVVDGTHLSGKFKGVLLTASGQDANFQVFPLAFAVVDSENDASWTWFFQKVSAILADSPTLTIISDRHPSISTAKKTVFPKSQHGACIVHLMRNVNSRFRSKGLAKLVGQAAFAFRPGGYRKFFEKITTTNPACAEYLNNIGPEVWSRAFFRGNRYNLMTSNVAEQLNSQLVKARASPIVELFMFIQRMLSRWFCARRKKSNACRGSITQEVDKIMTNSMNITKGSTVHEISPWTTEVVGQFGNKQHVALDKKSCTCAVFDKYHIPCAHALLSADKLGIPYDTLVSHWYKKHTWIATYQDIIAPDESPDDHTLPTTVTEMYLLPPRTRKPPGRPRTKRYLSAGEYPVTKKTKPNKCGRCGGERHNRTTCNNPI